LLEVINIVGLVITVSTFQLPEGAACQMSRHLVVCASVTATLVRTVPWERPDHASC
jgi:hypothetical protein